MTNRISCFIPTERPSEGPTMEPSPSPSSSPSITPSESPTSTPSSSPSSPSTAPTESPNAPVSSAPTGTPTHFRCLQETVASHDAIFSVTTATELSQITGASLDVANNCNGVEDAGCLPRVDIQIPSDTEIVSVVTLHNVDFFVNKPIYCEGKRGQAQNDDQIMVLEDFDPDAYECDYLDAASIVEPPTQARLAGSTTLFYETLEDFESDRDKNGLNLISSIEDSVSVVFGSSDKLRLESLTHSQLANSSNTLVLQIVTRTKNADVKVGTDLYDGPLGTQTTHGVDVILSSGFFSDLRFPSHIFLQSDDACVSSITLKLDQNVVASKDLADFASCSKEFAVDYNEELQCIRLSSTYLKDFALDLMQKKADKFCSQVSLRRDPSYMEALTFQVEGLELEGITFVDSQDELRLTPGDGLDSKPRLPVFPVARSQNESQLVDNPILSKIRIMSYDVVLFEWDANNTYRCLSSCAPFADQDGLLFMTEGSNSTIENGTDSQGLILVRDATFDLTATGCDMLTKMELDQGVSGEEECTQVEEPVDSLGEIVTYLERLDDNGKRTLKIIPTTNDTVVLEDLPSFAVPSFVRVQIDGSKSAIRVQDVC
ncbi:expressed unknown protein [Seminavis robusta]|uniref:Uncharacterized protein n=1 Tax=Seminavis robusta TaxID=568900 RepID=A0A9N8E2H1_9STRA|nr:expressed unknown protein [Seminavis robusta]|eukprot:Sro551_g164800.1 n/a (601) ;mRNA; f:5343-7423